MITRTYAVGQNNTVRRRDDHTGPWNNVNVPTSTIGTATLLDVMSDPTNPDRVCAVGDFLAEQSFTGIVVSNDAGANWFNPGGDWGTGQLDSFYEVWWVNTNVVWAIANNGMVVRSIDGGATFNKVSGNPASSFSFTSTIHALDDQVAIVAGATSQNIGANDTTVWKTIDGGNTWVTLAGSPLINTAGGGQNPTGPPEGIWMSPDQQRIIVSTVYNQFLSTDGGATFNAISPEFLRSGQHLTWYPSHDPTPSVFRHVGGPVFHVNQSTDIGSNWNTTRDGEFITVRGAHFYSDNEGYYLVQNQIYETSDGAVTGVQTDIALGIEELNAVWTGPWPIEPVDPPCGTCPEGFEYNSLTGLCERTESVSAICDPTAVYTVGEGAKLPGNYSALGAKFYEDASGRSFPIVHSGVDTLTDAASNPLNLLQTVAAAPWNDRLNEVGVWNSAANTPYSEWIGFTACVQIAEEKTYYVGIAGDNYVRFRLNGEIVFSATTGSVYAFRNWFMVPLTLPAGTNIIELEGLNLGSIAAFGAEIYDADQATLAAMTSTSQIDAVTVFSTKDKIGETFDLGEDSGCQCPDGYALSNCDGELECVRFETAEYIECPCYLATNCEDSQDTIVVRFEDENFIPDLSLTYIFDIDPDKCYTLEQATCQDDTPFVTINESFEDCAECAGFCYLLINCETQETIVVENDLAQYNGKVIQVFVDQDTTLCFTVQGIPCSGQTTVALPGNIIECFDNCIDCLPEPPAPEPPLVIRDRTVKPGWNTKGCPPEYVEKVSCNFAEAMYQEVASIRYGIEFCCENALNQDKWAIKKELLDLKAIYDPEACIIEDNLCCAPCNITAVITLQCEPVTYLIGSIEVLF